jgi:molybdopterin converting factor small subunit
MKVGARFHGILSDWIGTRSAEFELPHGAVYADLIKEIGRRFRKNMPDQLWDGQKNIFHHKVLGVKANKPVQSDAHPLTDGDVLTFFLMLAGG